MVISDKPMAFLDDVQREMYLMCPEGATVCPPYSSDNYAYGSSWQHKKAIIPSSITKYACGNNYYTLNYANVEEIIVESAAELPICFANSCSNLIKVTANLAVAASSYSCAFCDKLVEILLPKVTRISDRFCASCPVLKTVDLSSLTTITDTAAVFNSCVALETINLGNRNNVLTFNTASFVLSACISLTKESLLQIGNALTTTSSTKTIKFAAAVWAQLSASEQAIFTNKGYTITTV